MLATLALLLVPAVVPKQAPGEGPSHLGAYSGTVSGLARPIAVAFGPHQARPCALFVATRGAGDSSPPTIEVYVAETDPEGTVVTTRVGSVGAGWLERPAGLAVSSDGDVYVTDQLQRTLWRFPADGGEPVAAGQALAVPAGVDVTGTGEGQLIVVADPGAGAIKLIRAGSLASRTIGEGILVRPRGVCFIDGQDGEAQIAVCDRATHRIHVFRLDGTHVLGFSQLGPHPSLLSGPADLEFADGKLFVADRENHRVQAFHSGAAIGELAYRFGVHAIRPGEGAGALH
jgi:DNA-binding beta-propeller fold protein YncE